ncbi:MAG TPA: ABC transporter ATP-binding protein [Nocardioidaceae bacterium]|nr:ABC transporter ATP-binding protein [Nocardioidaceae bacterium]
MTTADATAPAPASSSEAQTSRDLRLESLTKAFGSFVAVKDLDLTMPRGSFFALLGPSGCGKTTTLRMVAGLEQPTQGHIYLGDDDITDLRPFKRPVNTVFQNYALFPHLTIFDNIAFGLRRRGLKDVDGKVSEMIDLVELGSQTNKKPAQLSGGQQQRVALARALINEPEVLLLDEPLGALDLKLRRQMQIELKRIQLDVGLTFVHVTHDQEEAMTMADTIAVMNGGVIEQMGPPSELYENPATTFVANFLGQSNLIRGEMASGKDGELVVDIHGSKIGVSRERSRVHNGAVWVGVRPEKVYISATGDEEESGDANSVVGGTITDTSFIGVSTQYLVKMPWGQELTVFEQNTGARKVFSPGTTVDLHWSRPHTFVLDANQDASAGVETVDDTP